MSGWPPLILVKKEEARSQECVCSLPFEAGPNLDPSLSGSDRSEAIWMFPFQNHEEMPPGTHDLSDLSDLPGRRHDGPPQLAGWRNPRVSLVGHTQCLDRLTFSGGVCSKHLDAWRPGGKTSTPRWTCFGSRPNVRK